MSKLARTILFNFVGQALLLVLGFVAVRFVYRQLGEDALGTLYFTLTLSTLLAGAMDMGVSVTVVREVSAHLKDDPRYVTELVRTAGLFYWTAYGIMALVVLWSAPFLVERWINLGSMDPATAARLLRILGCGALLALPRSLYGGLCRAIERTEFNNAIEVGVSLLQQAGAVVILVKGGGLFLVIGWISGCFGLGILLYALAVARLYSWAILVPGFVTSAVRRNGQFVVTMAGVAVFGVAHSQTDKAIASRLLPVGVFGYYAFLASVISRAMTLTAAISQAALPVLAAPFHASDHATLEARYVKMQDLVCLSLVPILAAVVFAVIPVFDGLFHKGIGEGLALPAAILCLGSYMNGTLQIPYVHSLAVGKPQITMRANALALFVSIPTGILLTRRWGLAGAAFSWVAYHLFAYAYLVPRLCRECLAMPVSRWYLQVGRIMLTAVLIYGGAWGALLVAGSRSWIAYGAAYLAGTAFFACCCRFLMGPELRATLALFWSRLRNRPGVPEGNP